MYLYPFLLTMIPPLLRAALELRKETNLSRLFLPQPVSLNLTLSDGPDGPEIGLWQTPTWVTWICLSFDPTTKDPDGGHEGVRRRYVEWVKSHADGVWTDQHLRLKQKQIKDHLDKIMSVTNPYFSWI